MPPDHHSAIDHAPPLPTAGDKVEHPGAPHLYQASYAEMRPEVIARLEWLDDLMFAAIDGDAASLGAAVQAWKKTVDELGAETVEESRRQYLRRAQSVWNSLRYDPDHSPHKTFAAIEIISLLAVRAW